MITYCELDSAGGRDVDCFSASCKIWVIMNRYQNKIIVIMSSVGAAVAQSV